MSKKIVLFISIVVNVILGIAFLALVSGAVEELKFNYVEIDTLTPDSIRKYLERENYGVAASLARPIRGGAEIDEEYMDYYMLGEYADLLFMKEVYAEAGNTQTVESCDKRLDEIRTKMPDYGSLFDKIELSAQNALAEKKDEYDNM